MQNHVRQNRSPQQQGGERQGMLDTFDVMHADGKPHDHDELNQVLPARQHFHQFQKAARSGDDADAAHGQQASRCGHESGDHRIRNKTNPAPRLEQPEQVERHAGDQGSRNEHEHHGGGSILGMPAARDVSGNQRGEGGENGHRLGVRAGDGEGHAAAQGIHDRHDTGADQSVSDAQGEI